MVISHITHNFVKCMMYKMYENVHICLKRVFLHNLHNVIQLGMFVDNGVSFEDVNFRMNTGNLFLVLPRRNFRWERTARCFG